MTDFDKFLPDEPVEPAKARHPSLDCLHTNLTIINGGLRKCLDCDSIEGLDKRWRNADVLWPS